MTLFALFCPTSMRQQSQTIRDVFINPCFCFQLKFNSSKSFSMLNLSNGGLTMPAERASPNMNKTQSQTDLAIGKLTSSYLTASPHLTSPHTAD